jgi:hypothetical protein
MNAQTPAPWLLKSEPDLTSDQVWLAVSVNEWGELEERLVIADSSEQVCAGIEMLRERPIAALNETMIDQAIARGEDGTILIRVRDTLIKLRESRGDGTAFDGRYLSNYMERSDALAADSLPGGRAQLEAQIDHIHSMWLQGRAQSQLDQGP